MKKLKRGRPRLPKKEVKQAVLTVRLDAAERKELDGAAKRDGLGLSKWVRAALLSAARPDNVNEPKPEDAGIEPHGGTVRGLGV